MADIKYIIPFTYKWEGGLSRAKTDTASKSPSPYAIKDPKDGVVKTGWHTNKGITYDAFKAGAKKYNYVDNKENFEKMPADIWLKIAKGSYWDVINLDAVKSQVIANTMFNWMWGSYLGWRSGFKKWLKDTKGIDWNISDLKSIPTILNNLTDKYGEKKILDELIAERARFFKSLNQPSNLKGWMNRLNDFQKFSYGLLESGIEATKKGIEEVKKKPLETMIITALVITSAYILYKTLNRRTQNA